MQLLIALARNVLNTDGWDRFTSQYQNVPEIYDWLNRQFRKWALNEGPSTKVTNLSDDAPDWARRAFETGGELVLLDYDELRDIAQPIIDYFNHLLSQGERIQNISVPDAIAKEHAWHKSFEVKDARRFKEDGITVIKTYPDGYSWVRLYGRSSLNREGDLMGHCVGDYCQRVRHGSTIIYSLRDPKNGPHVTLEADPSGEVQQIKGKANEDVIKKYQPYCVDFLAQQGFSTINMDGLDVPFVEIVEAAKKYGTYKAASWETVKIDTGVVLQLEETPTPREAFGKGVKVQLLRGKIQVCHFDNGKSYRRLEGAIYTPENELSVIKAWIWLCRHQKAGCSFSRSPYLYREKPSKAITKFLLSEFSVAEARGDLKIIRLTESLGWMWGVNDANTVIEIDGHPALVLRMTTRQADITVISESALGEVQSIQKILGRRRVYIEGAKTRDLKFKNAFAALEQKKPGAVKQLKVIDYTHIPTDLAKAISVFTNLKRVRVAAADLAKAKTWEDARGIMKGHGLTFSGYLYNYFGSWFALALCKNKALIRTVLSDNKAMMRQFQAFTVSPASIRAGAWYKRAGSNADTSMALIRHYMPKLVPLTLVQLKELGISFTVAKKIAVLYGYEWKENK